MNQEESEKNFTDLTFGIVVKEEDDETHQKTQQMKNLKMQ